MPACASCFDCKSNHKPYIAGLNVNLKCEKTSGSFLLLLHIVPLGNDVSISSVIVATIPYILFVLNEFSITGSFVVNSCLVSANYNRGTN